VSLAGRRRLEEALEERRGEEEGSDYKAIRRGWFFGNGVFRRELLEAVSAKSGKWHYGEELKESAEEKAERIVAEELKRRKWDASTLVSRRKGDKEKTKIAQRLRKESTMTLEWIARRLHMGTKTYLVHLLYWSGR
jgi:hypothetical protein